MPREKHKRPKPRGESTDAEHWGGPTRSSDEGPVMGLEQRDRVRRSYDRNNWKQDDVDAIRQTSRSISRRGKCTKRTKRSNPMRGAAGVDGQTIEQFEADLQGNLYKIWNRMSSGSYFPPPVRAVSIPKKSWRRKDFRCAHCQRSRGADGGQTAH